jgi:hypothetical protein
MATLSHIQSYHPTLRPLTTSQILINVSDTEEFLLKNNDSLHKMVFRKRSLIILRGIIFPLQGVKVYLVITEFYL